MWLARHSDDTAFLDHERLSEAQFSQQDVEDVQKLRELAVVTKIMGHNTPREQVVFSRSGKTYKFGGAPKTRPGFPAVLQKLANMYFEEADIAVVNFYRGNTDSIAWHTDAERNIDPEKVVSFSFGAERRFQMRAIANKREKQEVIIKDRDVYTMRGTFQEYFEHCVPKEKEVNNDMRINVTFRALRS